MVVLGVDLGTSHSRLAIFCNNQVEILKSIKSSVFYGNEETKSDIMSGASIFNIKRFIGRLDSDPVIVASKNLPFLVQTLDIGAPPFVAALVDNSWVYTPPSKVVSAFVARLTQDCKIYAEQGKTNVVMTVPVCFNRFQLKLLENACRVSNVDVVTFLPEPTAIAMLYADQQLNNRCKKNALIFNMGAGFCDVAVTSVQGGTFEMKSFTGSSYGGEDLLQNMIKVLLPDYEEKFKKYDLARNIKVKGMLHNSAQKAILQLSTQTSTQVEVEFEKDLRINKFCSRVQFEEANEVVFQKCKTLIRQCLDDAKIQVEDLHDVIITGGCSNIPKLRTIVSDICQVSVEDFYDGINPFEAAVSGAAIVGANNSFSNMLMVTHSIGIWLEDNTFFPVIGRNTKIPVSEKVIFTTTKDWKSEALLVVYEGDDAGNRHLLGHFKIIGIPKEKRGVPEICVRMEVDGANVLKVSARVTPTKSSAGHVPVIQVTLPLLENCHTGFAEHLGRICSGELNSICPKYA